MSENRFSEAHSPYAPPRSPVGEVPAAFSALKPFSYKGRIGRLRYLAWTMALTLVTLGIGSVFSTFGFALLRSDATSGLILAGLLAFIVVVVIAVLGVLFTVQRLHDIGWSGWLWLLTLVPFVGSFFPFVIMALPGNAGTNRYGAPAPPNSTSVKILSALWLVFIALMFIGGLAGGLSAIQSQYHDAAQSAYERDSGTVEEIEDQTATEGEPADPADDSAGDARAL
jgi:uncharacterized membrane protein YhaH (DUF805 family)